MDICQQILNFYRLYPLMRTQDYIKLLFQSEFMGGHFIKDEDESLRRILSEANVSVTQKSIDENESDDFLNISRVNIRPFVRAEKNLITLNQIFIKSNLLNNGNQQDFLNKLSVFTNLVKEKKINLPYLSVKRYINEYISNDCPLLSHSSAVKLNYYPSYRVVNRDFWFLFDIIDTIESLLNTNLTVTVAIDGNSGAGKSYFAKVLSNYYQCNVLSADDFFLPISMRSSDRLKEIGGNIHYERLRQTLIKMKDGDAFDYERYDCGSDKFVTKKAIPSRINIVEGCYCLHPYVSDLYNLGVILSVNKTEQRRRIISRDGMEKYERYENEWIPLENAYLKLLNSRYPYKKLPIKKISTDVCDY